MSQTSLLLSFIHKHMDIYIPPSRGSGQGDPGLPCAAGDAWAPPHLT